MNPTINDIVLAVQKLQENICYDHHTDDDAPSYETEFTEIYSKLSELAKRLKDIRINADETLSSDGITQVMCENSLRYVSDELAVVEGLEITEAQEDE